MCKWSQSVIKSRLRLKWHASIHRHHRVYSVRLSKFVGGVFTLPLILQTLDYWGTKHPLSALRCVLFQLWTYICVDTNYKVSTRSCEEPGYMQLIHCQFCVLYLTFRLRWSFSFLCYLLGLLQRITLQWWWRVRWWIRSWTHLPTTWRSACIVWCCQVQNAACPYDLWFMKTALRWYTSNHAWFEIDQSQTKTIEKSPIHSCTMFPALPHLRLVSQPLQAGLLNYIVRLLEVKKITNTY